MKLNRGENDEFFLNISSNVVKHVMSILIEVEKKDAKGNATKKTYKNVEDLKQKDKSAHELFQKHKKTGAGFRIQMNGNGNLMPFKAQPFKIRNARPKKPEQNKEKSVSQASV